MDKLYLQSNRRMFRLTTLTATLLSIYGSVHAQSELLLNTGETQTISVGASPYLLIDVRNGSTLNATGLSLDSTRGGQQGALVAKGATIHMSDSSIEVNSSTSTSGQQFRTYGIQAYADALGGVNTRITADNVTITTKGESGHGIQVFRRGTTDQTNVDVVLHNSTITTQRFNAYGMQANADGTGTGIGTITANQLTFSSSGEMGVGAFADGNKATITVNGGSMTTTGQNGSAVLAKAGGAVNLRDVTISTTGNDTRTNSVDGAAIGADTDSRVQVDGGSIVVSGSGVWAVHADSAASVGLNGTSITSSNAARGILSSGVGSQITAQNVVLNVGGTGIGTGELISGVQTAEGGQVTLQGGTMAMTGTRYTRALLASGASSGGSGVGSHITANGVQISTLGDNSHAVHAFGSSSATGPKPTIQVQGGHITTTGNESYALFAQNGSSITSSANITTSGQAGFGVYTFGAGKVAITGGSITTTGGPLNGTIGSFGVLSKSSGGQIDIGSIDVVTQGQLAIGLAAENEGLVQTQGTRVHTSGTLAFGVGALSQGQANLQDGTITTLGQEAHGLSAVLNSTIDARDLTVNTSGQQAYGAHSFAGSSLELEGTSIRTSGAGAHGLVMGVLSPTMLAMQESNPLPSLASTITMNGGSVVSTGAGAAGLYLENAGNVALTGVQVEATGSAINSQFTQAAQTQTISFGSGSTISSGADTLLRVDRNGAGADGKVELTLAAGAFASGNIANYLNGVLVDNNPLQTVFNKAGAHWAGIVIGTQTKVVQANTTQRYTDSAINDSVTGSQNSTIVFVNAVTIAGGVSTGTNSSVQFVGPTSIAENVVAQEDSSISFAGSTTIDQSVTGVGSRMQFSGAQTEIKQNFAASGSTAEFAGVTKIGGTLTAASNSSIVFSGTTTLGAGGNTDALKGESNSRFEFSRTASTLLQGHLNLSGGASTQGGTSSTPVVITGNAIVNDGAVLGGNLNVQGALSGQGGTLDPGNSIGRQTYATMGNFSGSTYLAEVNAAGQSDLITIGSGNADLRGIALKVGQEDGNGGYILNHDYLILETTQSDGIQAVAGNQFSSEQLDEGFTGSLVKLAPVQYGLNTVKVRLALDQTKADALLPSLSRNQRAVYDGALSVMGRNQAVDAALQSSNPAAALKQLSGEAHGSAQAAIQSMGGMSVNTVAARLRANGNAGLLPGAPMADASGTVPPSALPRSAAYPLWAQVMGSRSTLDGDGDVGETKSHATGLYVGGDVPLGMDWRVGGALGFTDARIRTKDTEARSDVRSYTGTLYAGKQWSTDRGQLNFMLGAGYTHHDIESERSLSVGGSQTLKADYGAHTTQLFTELGYAFPVAPKTTLEPYVGMEWSEYASRAFTETGGSAALRSQAQTDQVATWTLGLRGQTAVEVGRYKLRLNAQLGWRHATGDTDATRTLSFVQGNSTAFTVAGAPVARNAVVIHIGAEMDVGRNTALGMAYQRQAGNGNSDNLATVFLKARF